jgi:hypothetical protein
MQAASIAATEPRCKSAPSEKIEPFAECCEREMIQFSRARRTQFYFARACFWNMEIQPLSGKMKTTTNERRGYIRRRLDLIVAVRAFRTQHFRIANLVTV